jgi:hypothetical protein
MSSALGEAVEHGAQGDPATPSSNTGVKHSTVSPSVLLSDCVAHVLGWLITKWRALVFWSQRGERARLRAEMNAAREADLERWRLRDLERWGDVDACRKGGFDEAICGRVESWKYHPGDMFDGRTVRAIDRFDGVLYIDKEDQ